MINQQALFELQEARAAAKELEVFANILEEDMRRKNAQGADRYLFEADFATHAAVALIAALRVGHITCLERAQSILQGVPPGQPATQSNAPIRIDAPASASALSQPQQPLREQQPMVSPLVPHLPGHGQVNPSYEAQFRPPEIVPNELVEIVEDALDAPARAPQDPARIAHGRGGATSG